MKKSLYIAATLLVSAGAFTACQDDYKNVSDNNKVYDTAIDHLVVTALDGRADEMTRTLGVRIAQPETHDVMVTYGVDESKLVDYKGIYGGEPIILPAENYSIPDPVAVITANTVESSRVSVKFTGLNSLDDQFVYVLPVSIISSTVPALSSSATTYYVFRGAALINVVGDLTKTCLTFVNEGQCPELGNLRQLTFEALINPSEFRGQGGLATLMGIEGTFLVRIGDASVPPNQIQLATGSGNATDATRKLDTNKWTFVTLTFDSSTGNVDVYFNGVKKGDTQNVGYRRAVNWNVKSSDRACYVGYAYDTDRDFMGKISEVRVWNRILTPAELLERNHFYRVESDADGLVGYWKFNEGDGSLVHDYANGYDIQTPATYPGKSSEPGKLNWVSVSLPEQ